MNDKEYIAGVEKYKKEHTERPYCEDPGCLGRPMIKNRCVLHQIYKKEQINKTKGVKKCIKE